MRGMHPQLQPTGASLVTSDVRRLGAFYAAVLDADVDGDDVFATVSCDGGMELSIFAAHGMETMAAGSMDGSGRCILEVQVVDVDATDERICASGALLVKPPTTQPWGRRSVWFRDPDGTIVNFYSPVPPQPDPEFVVRTYFHRLLVERDLGVCDDLLADDYVDHDAPVDTPPGPSATRTYASAMLTDFPDLRFEVEELVTHGQTVALRATWRGTHRGTRKALRQRGLVFLHVEDGRLAERWSAYSDLDS
jgi:predicted ester cyclase/predicted enzyme related to lactoylglutathione lyase